MVLDPKQQGTSSFLPSAKVSNKSDDNAQEKMNGYWLVVRVDEQRVWERHGIKCREEMHSFVPPLSGQEREINI